jgi:hypothetical protein
MGKASIRGLVFTLGFALEVETKVKESLETEICESEEIDIISWSARGGAETFGLCAFNVAARPCDAVGFGREDLDANEDNR